jgi:hypothetical protein
MDPEVLLARLRALVEQVTKSAGRGHTVEEREFAENFSALDEWLSHGGFAPMEWAADVSDRPDIT